MNKEEVLEHALSLKYGGMSKNELAFMYDICANRDVLELGSMVGMSSYVIASVAKSLSCVDVWADTWEHLEHDPQQQTIYSQYEELIPSMLNSFKKNCKDFIDSGKIIMHRGNTNDIAHNFSDKSFDVVLIDADHSYQGVSQDFGLYKNKVKDGGVIVFHDYGDSMWLGVTQFANKMVYSNQLEIVARVERIGVFKIL